MSRTVDLNVDSSQQPSPNLVNLMDNERHNAAFLTFIRTCTPQAFIYLTRIFKLPMIILHHFTFIYIGECK